MKTLLAIVMLTLLSTSNWAKASGGCPSLMSWLSRNSIQGPIPGTAPVHSLFLVPHEDFLTSFVHLSQKAPVSVVIPSTLIKPWEYHDLTDYKRIAIYPEITASDEQFNFTSLWARDYLPTLVVNQQGGLEFVQFTYFKATAPRQLKLYNKYAQGLARLSEVPLKKSELIFQGGNLIVDEEGTLFLSRKVQIETKGGQEWPSKRS